MKLLTLSILVVIGLGVRSCGRKPAAESPGSERSPEAAASASDTDADEDRESGEEDEKAPDSGDVGEDCISFLRATKIAPSSAEKSSDCPQCPAADAEEVFQFNDVKIDRVTPSENGSDVDVRIFATFRPGRGGSITGGLTGWIPTEQRAQFERGEIPAGQQVYRVRITYRRTEKGWQPIEFSPIAP